MFYFRFVCYIVFFRVIESLWPPIVLITMDAVNKVDASVFERTIQFEWSSTGFIYLVRPQQYTKLEGPC